MAGCTTSGEPSVSSDTGGPAARQLAHGHWGVLPTRPVAARQDVSLVWAGRVLLEFGGTSNEVPQADGAAYDPERKGWQPMASPPIVVGTADEAHVWTGSDLFVFGGRRPPYHGLVAPPCCEGALYNPTTNRWTVTSRSPLPALPQAVAVWTGRVVVVVELASAAGSALRAASYDPVSDTWQRVDPPQASGHPPEAFAVVAAGDRVILWSMWGRVRRTGPGATVGYSGVDVLRLAGNEWATVTGRWPQHHTVDHPTYTGREIVVGPGQIWCGACSHPPPIGEHGYTADPESLAITPIPAGPLDDLGPWIGWTGRAEISLNASGEMTGPHVHVRPGDVAFWDPRSKRWTRGPRAPRPLEPATQPVWGASRLFVLAADGRVLTYSAD
jgi:hypothetical protein